MPMKNERNAAITRKADGAFAVAVVSDDCCLRADLLVREEWRATVLRDAIREHADRLAFVADYGQPSTEHAARYRTVPPAEHAGFALARRLFERLRTARDLVHVINLGELPDGPERVERELALIENLLQEAEKALDDRQKFYIPGKDH